MRYTKWDRKVIISIITGLKYCQIELLCPMRTSCLLIFTWIVFIMIKSENIFLSKFTIFINQIDSWYHIIEWNVFVLHIFFMSKNLFNFFWCDTMLYVKTMCIWNKIKVVLFIQFSIRNAHPHKDHTSKSLASHTIHQVFLQKHQNQLYSKFSRWQYNQLPNRKKRFFFFVFDWLTCNYVNYTTEHLIPTMLPPTKREHIFPIVICLSHWFGIGMKLSLVWAYFKPDDFNTSYLWSHSFLIFNLFCSINVSS